MKVNKYSEYSDIVDICEKYYITNFTIKDVLVNVEGDVNLNNKKLTELPLKFGVVSGSFYCFYCFDNELTTLEGSPSEVGVIFHASGNKIKDLSGAPKKIGYNLYLNDNLIESLVGLTVDVGNSIVLSDNKIYSLEGIDYMNYDCYLFLGNKVDEIWSKYKFYKEENKYMLEYFLYINPIYKEKGSRNPKIDKEKLLDMYKKYDYAPMSNDDIYIKGYDVI